MFDTLYMLVGLLWTLSMCFIGITALGLIAFALFKTGLGRALMPVIGLSIIMIPEGGFGLKMLGALMGLMICV